MTQSSALLTGFQAIQCIRNNTLKVEAYVRDCLDRIASRDAQVCAWTYIEPEALLRQARELDRQENKGLLHGLPIGIKDVIMTCDMPTQYNSPIYYRHYPNVDAACISILRNAGALILGKTDTVEFAAMGRRAVTTNPFDHARTPGGSSSGSGAAVADYHVPVTLGTQTGGSIIRPASFCGVYAMKPTWNAVSSEGLKRYAASLDTLGWYGRCVDDLIVLSHIYNIIPTQDILAFPLKGARIAYYCQPEWDKAEQETRDAMSNAILAMQEAGVSVEKLVLPSEFNQLNDAQSVIMYSEGTVAFLQEYRRAKHLLHEDFQGQVENRRGISKAQIVHAYDLAAKCRMLFDQATSMYDAILTPSAPGEATLGLKSTGDSVFNRSISLLHAPCINIPAYKGPNALPVGLTLTGPRYSDEKLLAVAKAIAPVLVRSGGWSLPYVLS